MTVLLIKACIFLFITGLGALAARMDGGGKPKTPEWVEKALVIFPFVICTWPYAGYYCAIGGIGLAGPAMGHGQYFLRRLGEAVAPERVDFIVRLFFGEDPRSRMEFYTLRGLDYSELSPEQRAAIQRAMDNYGMDRLYRRCVFGMFLGGCVIGLPAAGVALYFGAWLPALYLSLTGFIKAAAYHYSYKIFKSTEQAEWANGGGRSALAAAAYIHGF